MGKILGDFFFGMLLAMIAVFMSVLAKRQYHDGHVFTAILLFISVLWICGFFIVYFKTSFRWK